MRIRRGCPSTTPPSAITAPPLFRMIALQSGSSGSVKRIAIAVGAAVRIAPSAGSVDSTPAVARTGQPMTAASRTAAMMKSAMTAHPGADRRGPERVPRSVVTARL